jgi:hypothetical protein
MSLGACAAAAQCCETYCNWKVIRIRGKGRDEVCGIHFADCNRSTVPDLGYVFNSYVDPKGSRISMHS